MPLLPLAPPLRLIGDAVRRRGVRGLVSRQDAVLAMDAEGRQHLIWMLQLVERQSVRRLTLAFRDDSALDWRNDIARACGERSSWLDRRNAVKHRFEGKYFCVVDEARIVASATGVYKRELSPGAKPGCNWGEAG